MTVNILMVEDNQDQQNLYKDYLEENPELFPAFNITFSSNASDAINQLNNRSFDALFWTCFLKVIRITLRSDQETMY